MVTVHTDGEGGVWLRLRERGGRYRMPSGSTVALWATMAVLMGLAMVATWHDLHLPE